MNIIKATLIIYDQKTYTELTLFGTLFWVFFSGGPKYLLNPGNNDAPPVFVGPQGLRETSITIHHGRAWSAAKEEKRHAKEVRESVQVVEVEGQILGNCGRF